MSHIGNIEMEKESYTTEFKNQAVMIAVKYKTEGKTYLQIGKSLGLKPSIIRKWIMSTIGLNPKESSIEQLVKDIRQMIGINTRIEKNTSEIISIFQKVPGDLLKQVTEEFSAMDALNEH